MARKQDVCAISYEIICNIAIQTTFSKRFTLLQRWAIPYLKIVTGIERGGNFDNLGIGEKSEVIFLIFLMSIQGIILTVAKVATLLHGGCCFGAYIQM